MANHRLLIVGLGILGLLLAGPGGAAPTAGAPVAAPAPPTAEQLRQQGARLAVVIRSFANQEEAITQQMVELDGEIEAQVERIVDLLASIKDSQDSSIKVIQTQEMALEGLKKMVEFYAREREQRRAALEQPYTAVAKDDLVADVAALQKRIDTRVEQIVQLSNSLVQQTDFKKTETHYDSDGDTRTRTSPSYSHNRSTARRASGEREQLKELFKAAIEKLNRDNRDLEKQLEITSAATERQRLQELIDFNRELIAKRQAQLEELALPAPAPAREIGNREAMDLKQGFRDAVAEIRQQHQELMRLSARRDRLRIETKAATEQLAAIGSELAKAEEKQQP